MLHKLSELTGFKIDFLYKENIRKVTFPEKDASQMDQEALREVWYWHEEKENETEFNTNDIYRQFKGE